jgi:hypothetical protein
MASKRGQAFCDSMPFLIAILLLALGGTDLAMDGAPSAPALPGKWKLVPEFTDEFDAPKLDQAKWQPRNPEWSGRPPGCYQEQNVVIKEGKLHLLLKAENVPEMPPGYQD